MVVVVVLVGGDGGCPLQFRLLPLPNTMIGQLFVRPGVGHSKSVNLGDDAERDMLQ